MNVVVSLIILDINNSDLNPVLKNILNQSITNWELFLILDPNIKNSYEVLEDNRIKLIEKCPGFILKDYLLLLLPTIKGEFLCILNSYDINHIQRLEKQSDFMINNSNIYIISCLSLPIANSVDSNNKYNECDMFVTEEEVDFATLGGYVPLDIYTFMIRKDFLITVSKFLYNYTLEKELDFILFLLRYTSIGKIPQVLYYFQTARVPYAESVFMTNTLKTTNKIAIFNRNKSIECRQYLSSAILKNTEVITSNVNIKYNILIIIEALNIGGTETYILSLCKSLLKFGIYTYIITSDGVLEDLFIQNGITILKTSLYLAKDNSNEYKYLIDYISKIIINNHIKLIHIHSANVIPLSCDLKSIFNIPLILTIHGTFYPDNLIKQYSTSISKFIFVSQEVLNFYLPVLTDRKELCFDVIHNSIEPLIKLNNSNYLHNILDIPLTSKIILYCSRLSFGKAPAAITFLKSFEKIALENDNIYAVILGDGDKKIFIDSYANNINTFHKKKKVFILGAVYNVNDYYSDSTFVIGTGRVALEAMNCSKPVITLGLNGLVYLVNDSNILDILNSNFGDHSSLVNVSPLGNYSESLTKIISYLLDNPFYTNDLGIWSKDYCNNHLNINYSTESIIKIFDTFINNNLY